MPTPADTATMLTHTIAWQGWSIDVPAAWNPVKIDGDARRGSVLLADLRGPRLGLRWEPGPMRRDAAAWAERALHHEIGRLAAGEATDVDFRDGDWATARLYADPDPPGRDVFVGHSRVSNRVLQLVHHAGRPHDPCVRRLLSTLRDTPPDAPQRWSVFEFVVRAPHGVTARWYRFNAGDLSLGLHVPGVQGLTVIRQVGPATLALSRQPLDAWLTRLPAHVRRLYRPAGIVRPAVLRVDGRRVLAGRRLALRRRRRWAWAWWLPRREWVLAFHDDRRDRLLIGQSSGRTLLRRLMSAMGSKP